MSDQNIKNHIRFYVPHHFIFYPLILALTISSVYYLFTQPEERVIFSFITAILFLIGWLSFMTRQHYALNNQNRIVRLEMRLRYYQLTGQPFEIIEDQLSFSQIAALRFASNTELIPLIKRTVQENLQPKVIKQAIQHWIPDYMRA
ncbi:DUF6526 family protein [Arcticibacter eurypsychrophilus]|uniref:DUF6526 family protein n=1 Tax=Arcticibacter eurypsychrophilus TaxID=1434752 RepID=UPI00084D415E|nr:DUF6526 family protein [Arcticibacter eurypsychrophilus]